MAACSRATGLTFTYTAFNKPATITRGTASVSFDHDPEHQRYAQTSLSGVTLYISGGGVLAERFAGTGGTVRWTNYLIVGGRFIGIHVENSDETTLTRYPGLRPTAFTHLPEEADVACGEAGRSDSSPWRGEVGTPWT